MTYLLLFIELDGSEKKSPCTKWIVVYLELIVYTKQPNFLEAKLFGVYSFIVFTNSVRIKLQSSRHSFKVHSGRFDTVTEVQVFFPYINFIAVFVCQPVKYIDDSSHNFGGCK